VLPEEQYGELVQAIGMEALEKAGRQIALAVVDDLWADYLANVAELRGGIHWASWTGGNPLYKFLTGEREIYEDFHRWLKRDLAAEIHFPQGERLERGATWTYITTDQPFGPLSERIMKALRRTLSKT
jgi:preprotein translocase subunit SecA